MSVPPKTSMLGKGYTCVSCISGNLPPAGIGTSLTNTEEYENG